MGADKLCFAATGYGRFGEYNVICNDHDAIARWYVVRRANRKVFAQGVGRGAQALQLALEAIDGLPAYNDCSPSSPYGRDAAVRWANVH